MRRLMIATAVTLMAAGVFLAQQPSVKPTMTDTMRASMFADNWFAMYINGKLVVVDSIDFLPHNQMNVDLLPEYPMTIAVIAKDNADPSTGLEYGDQMGDAGFILRFADGTVTNSTWKTKTVFRGPVNRDPRNPEVAYDAVPTNWFAPDFDDREWSFAREFTEEEVRPGGNYARADFSGARFIWSDDLVLDNTVLFRYRVEKPGWKPRWDTHPELDNTCVFSMIPLACQMTAPAGARSRTKE